MSQLLLKIFGYKPVSIAQVVIRDDWSTIPKTRILYRTRGGRVKVVEVKGHWTEQEILGVVKTRAPYDAPLRDRIAHRLANTALRLATRDYQNFIEGSIRLGLKTASEQSDG